MREKRRWVSEGSDIEEKAKRREVRERGEIGKGAFDLRKRDLRV